MPGGHRRWSGGKLWRSRAHAGGAGRRRGNGGGSGAARLLWMKKKKVSEKETKMECTLTGRGAR